MPQHPAELAGHDGLVWHAARRGGGWRFRPAGGGEPCCVAPLGRLHSTNADMLAAAAAQAVGVVVVPTSVAEDAVAAGTLAPLLPDWQADPLAVHLAYRSRRQLPLSVRCLIEHVGGAPGAAGR